MSFGGGLSRVYVKNSGRYSFTFNVDEEGIPGVYEVVLFSRKTKLPIESKLSDSTGVISFNGLAENPSGYFAIAFDYGDNANNAAISDYLTPEL